MATPAVQAHGLVKSYGDKRVVDALDMNVEQGDIYGFVGRNGAGKSTTMKIICGLTEPTEGSMELFGKPLGSKGACTIGSLIEAPGLLNTLPALDNLMVKAMGMGVRNAKLTCQGLLDFVGLGNTGNRKAKDFSLGMRQRLGIALALVGEPDLLLLDEPFNGLDPEATRTMRSTLQKLNKEKGITIIVSSHILDQLNRFANRFGVINAGHMVAEFDGDKMHELGQTHIRVRTYSMPETTEMLKKQLPQASFMEKDGALLIAGDVALEHVSQILFTGNQQVVELTPVERDVEEFFLSLMQSGQIEGKVQ